MRRAAVSFGSIIVLWLLGLTGAAYAQTKDVELYESTLQSLESQKTERTVERDKRLAESNALAEKIVELKRQLAREKSLIKEYQLKERLRESNQLSQTIDALSQQLAKLEKDIRAVKDKLDVSYERRIDEQIRRLEKEPDARQKEQALKEIITWRRRRAELLALQPSTGDTLAALPKVTVQADDTPAEIQEKINWVRDYQDKLDSHVQALDAQIKRYRGEKRTREKLAEFIAESDLTTGDASLGGAAATRRSGTVTAPGGYNIPDRSGDAAGKQGRDVAPNEPPHAPKRSLDDEIKRLEHEKKLLQERRKLLAEELKGLEESLKAYGRKDDGCFLLEQDLYRRLPALLGALRNAVWPDARL